VVSNVIYARLWQAGDRVLGVALERSNNAAGVNGAKTIQIKRSCYRFGNDGTINASHIGLNFCKPTDNQTVALDGLVLGAVKSATTAGVIADVDALGVWVEFRIYG
jgi:hypothetical protein